MNNLDGRYRLKLKGSPVLVSKVIASETGSILNSKDPQNLSLALSQALHLSTTHPLVHTTDVRSSLGRVIQLMRKEKGLSQEELAKKTHIDRTTIARVESGVFKSLSIEKLDAIAQAFGIDLKALLLKSSSEGEALTLRGHVSRVEFALEYPEAGFRIISFIPRRKEFFFGKIEIQPKRTIPSDKLPHPEQVYLHALEGKTVLIRDLHEFLLKPGDCFAFSGRSDYELFNPDQLKDTSSFFITYPSFLPV